MSCSPSGSLKRLTQTLPEIEWVRPLVFERDGLRSVLLLWPQRYIRTAVGCQTTASPRSSLFKSFQFLPSCGIFLPLRLTIERIRKCTNHRRFILIDSSRLDLCRRRSAVDVRKDECLRFRQHVLLTISQPSQKTLFVLATKVQLRCSLALTLEVNQE
jgi:hypothetical protein